MELFGQKMAKNGHSEWHGKECLRLTDEIVFHKNSLSVRLVTNYIRLLHQLPRAPRKIRENESLRRNALKTLKKQGILEDFNRVCPI